MELWRAAHASSASTMLTSEAVGNTRVIVSPAAASNILYSAAVRSSPPGIVSITMSAIFPKCGVSPSGSTNSTISSLAPDFIALRQLPRIVRH